MSPSENKLSQSAGNSTSVELHDAVRDVLARSSFQSGRDLRFEVHGAEVVLRGVVRSYYQKQLAQESLRAVRGVSQVRNEIEVVST